MKENNYVSNQLDKAAKNKEYLAMIDRGISQLETGKGQEHELIEENSMNGEK